MRINRGLVDFFLEVGKAKDVTCKYLAFLYVENAQLHFANHHTLPSYHLFIVCLLVNVKSLLTLCRR